MPTENRSSNTEIAKILAPFAAVADCYSDAEDDSFEPACDHGQHKDLALTLGQFRAVRLLLNRPDDQHQGEPIAWVVGSAIWWNKHQAEVDAKLVGESAIPLGRLADAGEVERLREIIGQQKSLIESLRAELIESRSVHDNAEPACPICHGTLRAKEPGQDEGDCTRCTEALNRP